jgi:hypothetical protein
VFLLVMLVSKLAGLRRSLCVNYVIDESVLALPERDVFTAAQIAGLRPLAGRSVYLRFVAANAWVAEHFPNFHAAHRARAGDVPEVSPPRWCERLLRCGPAQVVEAASRRWLGRRLERRASGHSGVALSAHRLKLHVVDHRPRLLAAWAAALAELGEPLEARR